MKKYGRNSPEAMARILAMFMIIDGNVDDRELDSLDKLHVYPLLGVTRSSFLVIFKQYLNDITDEAEAEESVKLIDTARINSLIAEIDDRKKRIMLCALLLDIGQSDKQISDQELAFLKYIMKAWGISLADVETELVGSSD